MRESKDLSKVPNVGHAFFNRNGGVSEEPFASLNTSLNVGDDKASVLENRRRICSQLNVSPRQLFLPKQVHGDVIVRVFADTSQEDIAEFEADAIWTTHPHVAVGVQTADCAPLLLTNHLGTAVMAVHLGWRSTALGLAQKAARHFSLEAKTPLDEIIAAIGPCIGFDAFEVGPEVVEALNAQVNSEGLVFQKDATHFQVDLAGWIHRALKDIGIVQVYSAGECTFSHPERYFSYRRDGAHAGRQVSVIAMK